MPKLAGEELDLCPNSGYLNQSITATFSIYVWPTPATHMLFLVDLVEFYVALGKKRITNNGLIVRSF